MKVMVKTKIDRKSAAATLASANRPTACSCLSATAEITNACRKSAVRRHRRRFTY